MPTSSTPPRLRRAYPSDLSDAQWAVLQDLVPPAVEFPNLQKPIHDRREIVNAILYRIRTGCAWRMLPNDFPPWNTVYNTYARWSARGDFEVIHNALRDSVRQMEGRLSEPTAGIMDSQTAKGSVQSEGAGFDAAKKTKGRKRHVLIDTLGLLLVVLVTSGNVQDRDAVRPIVHRAAMLHSNMTKIWADGGYQGDRVRKTGHESGIDIEIVKRSDDMSGFVVLPRRWVVERTFGWLERCRIFSREYERTETSSKSNVFIAMSALMLRRLAGEAQGRFPRTSAVA